LQTVVTKNTDLIKSLHAILNEAIVVCPVCLLVVPGEFSECLQPLW